MFKSNSFEKRSDESMDIERFHKDAEKIIDQSQFKEDDFVPPYSQDSVNEDKKKIETIQAQFDKRDFEESKEAKKLADIFEASVMWNGEQSDWFGVNASTTKTSKFDDLTNGVDLVVEFAGVLSGSASYVGLATDVTFKADTTSKFDKIRGRIDDGKLAKVKYFHSNIMNFHGQMSQLPEVVIGANRKAVMELAELRAAKKFKQLGEHPIQIMILHQIEAQLETYGLYAESIGNHQFADVFNSRLSIIQGILEAKKDLVAKTKYEINDLVHSDIIEFMHRWKKTILDERKAA